MEDTKNINGHMPESEQPPFQPKKGWIRRANFSPKNLWIAATIATVAAVIALWFWNNSLDPWEETAVRFWSVGGVHQDIQQTKSMLTPDSPIQDELKKFQITPDQPGKVWVATIPGKNETEKTVWVLLDRQPKQKVNLRTTYLEQVGGEWRVSSTLPEQVNKEQFLKETEAEGVEWKEAELH